MEFPHVGGTGPLSHLPSLMFGAEGSSPLLTHFPSENAEVREGEGCTQGHTAGTGAPSGESQGYALTFDTWESGGGGTDC